MEITSLAHTPFETLAEAFGAAFAEYEVRITSDELRTMLRRRGFDPALSFAAFDGRNSGRPTGKLSDSGTARSSRQGCITGFTLNGVGSFAGMPTAYDTGTGTLPEYRGQGLATRIFEASLPHLREAGIRQYLLEVLQHNTAAVSVYRRLGFEISREFNYFRAASGDLKIGGRVGGVYEIRQVESVALGAMGVVASEFWDFEPSWQNSFEAIGRAPDDFITLAAYCAGDSPCDPSGSRMTGYIIFEPAAGDITQIAVAKSHRRRGVGSSLLGEMLHLNCAPGIKCINTEIGRDEALAGFLQAWGITPSGKQFEMIKPL